VPAHSDKRLPVAGATSEDAASEGAAASLENAFFSRSNMEVGFNLKCAFLPISPRHTMQTKAIQVYSWPTPNGHKVHIMLEECGLPYTAIPVNIGTGDQFKLDFLKISPNNKIPAIVDPQGPDGKPISLFESGAILVYLAGKTGKFIPTGDRARYDVLQWLMFQMGGVGPMLGQNHHFRLYAPEKLPYAIDRYTNEAKRIYGVIDRQLTANKFIAGKSYSIADMAIYPWLRNWKNQGMEITDYPALKKWFDALEQRPAVQRGTQVLADLRKPITDNKAREVLFGKKQYEKR
jgi:GSH-dependent disulfide-bond oxidoreductase